MRLTIGMKLIGGFCMVLAVMTVIIAAVIVGVGKVDTNFKFIEEKSEAAMNGIMETRIAFLQKALIHSMIMQGEIEEIEQIADKTDKTLIGASSTLKNSGLVSQVDISEINSIHTGINEALEKMVNVYRDNTARGEDTSKMANIEAVINSEAIKEFDKALGYEEALLIKLSDRMNAKAYEAFRAAHRTMNLIRLTSVLLWFIGIVLGLVIGGVVSWAISKLIRKGIVQITSASSQILAAAEEQATGIEEEAAQISEVAASSKELSATARQVTESAQEISRYTTSTMEIADSGGESVNNVINGMERIRQSILETAKRIESLGERSQDIAEIVTLIEDVADQTNILSLNAAIEAARAGEAGKGFAVVAEAIGKLAERTAKSTKDISALVKTIQQDTSSCVMSMEESTKETDTGATLAKEAGKKLEDIQSSFKHVAESVREIVLASQQQASGSEQISKAIVGVDQVMRQSAQGAKQSEELAKNLVGLANELKETGGEVRNQRIL